MEEGQDQASTVGSGTARQGPGNLRSSRSEDRENGHLRSVERSGRIRWPWQRGPPIKDLDFWIRRRKRRIKNLGNDMGTRTESWGVSIGLPGKTLWDGRGPVPEYLTLGRWFTPTQSLEIRWSQRSRSSRWSVQSVVWPTGQTISISHSATGQPGQPRNRLSVTFPIPSPVHLGRGDGSLLCGCSVVCIPDKQATERQRQRRQAEGDGGNRSNVVPVG